MIDTAWNAVRKSWTTNGRLKFIFVALGIFFSYFIVGILQEKIMKGCYGDDQTKCEKFKYAVTIALVQNFLAFFIIKCLDCIKPGKKDETPMWYYIIAGIVFSLAMVFTTMALRWVSFPMQVIFKSAKPIAVMLINLFMCKRYTPQRYFFVLIIVVGVVVFKIFEATDTKEKPHTKSEAHGENTDMYQWYGIGVLSFSLLMDGTLGALEDKIRRLYSPTSNQMMISICGWSSAALIITVAATTEIIDVYNFATRHPKVLWELALLGLAGALGQVFIFTMVASFGALSCSVTTTVRKFISVVFSIVFFGHPSTVVQWIGTVLVFAALLADAFWGKKQLFGKKADKTKHIENPTEIKATTSKPIASQPTAPEEV